MEERTSVTEELAAAQGLFEAWNRRDVPAMVRYLSPDIEWRPTRLSRPWARVYRGHAAVQEWTQELSRRGLRVHVVPERFVQSGARIALYGTLEADEPRRPPEKVRLAWVMEIEGGLVVRAHGFEDAEAARRALEEGM